MKLLDARIALLMGTVGFLAVGCGSKTDSSSDTGEPDTDTDTDTDTDDTDDEDTADTGVDTAYYGITLSGEGEAGTDGWTGTESQQYYSITRDRIMCTLTWDSTSVADVTDDCKNNLYDPDSSGANAISADCTFAFEMNYADMTIDGAELCDDIGWTDEAGPRVDSNGVAVSQSYGHAATYTYAGNEFTDVMLFLYDVGWYPMSIDQSNPGYSTADTIASGYSWEFSSRLITAATTDWMYAQYP